VSPEPAAVTAGRRGGASVLRILAPPLSTVRPPAHNSPHAPLYISYASDGLYAAWAAWAPASLTPARTDAAADRFFTGSCWSSVTDSVCISHLIKLWRPHVQTHLGGGADLLAPRPRESALASCSRRCNERAPRCQLRSASRANVLFLRRTFEFAHVTHGADWLKKCGVDRQRTTGRGAANTPIDSRRFMGHGAAKLNAFSRR
jgi:hypothetical protein